MERNSNLGLKLAAIAVVAAGGMARSHCNHETALLRPQPTTVVSDVKPSVPDLAAVQKETHAESVQALKPVDPQVLTDGKCHLKDPDAETVLLSLKALDPKLLDSYIDSQLSVCAEK